jgi:hypothetical protein
MEALLLDDREERELWKTWGPAVLAKWLRDRPGTRPALWWKYDAPRLPDKGTGAYWDGGKLPEPRRRLGGRGRTKAEEAGGKLVFLLNNFCGIPANGENWAFYDPSDPPQYESQASYLQRHGLLSHEEGEALKTRPEAFEPEIIKIPT